MVVSVVLSLVVKTKRWSHNVLNVISVILAMCICLPLGYVTKHFDSSCILFSNVTAVVGLNETVNVNRLKTKWGDKEVCYFTTFMPVIVAIHCFIWTWFYFHMKQTIKDGGKEALVLLSMTVLYSIMCICMVISSSMITRGFNVFCANLEKYQKRKNGKTYECNEFEDLIWRIVNRKRPFYTFLHVSEISSWLLVISLAIQIGLASLRAFFLLTKPGEFVVLKEAEYGSSSEAQMDDETGSILFISPDTRVSNPEDQSYNSPNRDSYNFSSERNLLV
ncbi:hypothetical protein LOTGIDRAFT_229430 [Lottia gigantea]|uniref:Uncharacterized protein n=1 Tax=Lottia gigantea TaxID=225164 RepID=V3Z444_LOTGI|nr:hypothetical protein LOTGIDRAFT_229430 [Lottia gigantea]ESO85413.1 hypothetical protein LOTGIDRAFT_229430 [Lottia gigantea]